ncbi:hypothetical protein [Spiroplasma clarkii]|uniref:hypothetical protein n=1 Tax=Spiroplasma clarkii TaxID=2139 RepID=UPI0011BA53B6|nr:hypothetical protein [Spiroplasma clarkii]
MKELIEKMQDSKIITYFNELLTNGQMFHSTIFSCNNQTQLENIVEEIIRMTICENHAIKNDGCALCCKFEKNNLLNLIRIGDGVNLIKKESVNELITSFSSSTFEQSSLKVYLIKNVENLTETAANAILKLLEEPPTGVFAFLLTNDRNQIISTIKSRCKTIMVEERVVDLDIDLELLDLIQNNKKMKPYCIQKILKEKTRKNKLKF